MLLNCGVGEDSWESLGLQGDQTSPFERKWVLNIHGKDWGWSWSSILWPPDVKSRLLRKDPDAGKDWRQEEKGTTEDEMVGWYHGLSGHEFEQAPGDGKDREAWHAIVHGVTKNQAWLSIWTTTALSAVRFRKLSHLPPILIAVLQRLLLL